jgi:hypothetical protein
MAFAQRKGPSEEGDDVPMVDLDSSDASHIICTQNESTKLTTFKLCIGLRGHKSLPRPQGAFYYHPRNLHKP